MENLIFISMEGRKNFHIGDFQVREDVSLPVSFEGEKFSIDKLTPENIISGMIKVLIENPETDYKDYYKKFIFSVQPEILERLSNIAGEAMHDLRFTDAVEIYKVINILNENSLDNIIDLAVCYDEYSNYLYSQGKSYEAEKIEVDAYQLYKLIDEFQNKNDRAYYYMGSFYLVRENYNKALSYFQDFIEVSNDIEKKEEIKKIIKNITSNGLIDEDYKTALELIQSDKEEDSIGYIDRFIFHYPESWNGYYAKGTALRKLEKYDEAIKLFDKALLLNPDSVDIFNELALCYMNMKLFHKSQLYFNKALRNNPDDSNILYNLAVCNYKKGDITEALKYCNVILEFNPKDLNTIKLKKILENPEIE